MLLLIRLDSSRLKYAASPAKGLIALPIEPDLFEPLRLPKNIVSLSQSKSDCRLVFFCRDDVKNGMILMCWKTVSRVCRLSIMPTTSTRHS